MNVFHSIEEMRQWRNSIAANTKQSGLNIGFVPTMGALHEGHAELLRRSVRENQQTVLSIYVNPSQFSPNEDLSKYPRTFESDLALAEKCGVQAVFAPTDTVMYGNGYSTYVEENSVSQPLCGVSRPTHFRGVTTIVLKLFHIVRPTIAYFGLKDAQQYFVIRKMVQDLNLDLNVVAVPTVRESTGLALSSRNRYLSDHDRMNVAPRLFEVLNSAKNALSSGADIAATEKRAIETLSQLGFHVQYFEVRSVPQLQKLQGLLPEKTSAFGVTGIQSPSAIAIIATAALLGPKGRETRLIDNVMIESPSSP